MYQIILDVDGVLVDTDNSYSQAAILTAEELGARKRSMKELFTLRSLGNFNDDYDVTMEFLRQDGIELPRQEVIKKFQNYYLGSGWQEGVWDGLITQEPLLPNEAFIDWINEQHFSVFTGRPKDEAFYVIRRLGIFDRMQHLVGMHDVSQRKPDPEGINQIIALNGYCQVISCGDTLDDLIAARAAKVSFVGILPPNEEARNIMIKAFKDNDCQDVLDSINDLPALIEKKQA